MNYMGSASRAQGRPLARPGHLGHVGEPARPVITRLVPIGTNRTQNETSCQDHPEPMGREARGRYGKRKALQISTVLDFLVTDTGLRVMLYGVVVTTFALGVLCMTVLIVGYHERRPERRKARSVIV